MACKDCALYDIAAVTSETGKIMSRRAARCFWVEDLSFLPASIKESGDGPRPRGRRFMQPREGDGCRQMVSRQGPNPILPEENLR